MTIKYYVKYELREVSLNSLSLNLDKWGQDARVITYAEMERSKQPPIILGCTYTTGKFEVVDGVHRAAASKKRGEINIQAYVPIE